MNYTKIYQNLIERAITRTLPTDTYVEKHHVVPKCMNGTDDSSNLVNLTAEEHYLAHQLLVKIYPDNHKLIYGANMMCVCQAGNNQRSNNKRYGWLKRKFSETQKGKTLSEETRRKMSESAKGKTHSEESRRKISENKKGREHSEESRRKISEKLKGRPRSPETVAKRLATLKRNRELKLKP
jgi:hypothetical protein